MVTMGGSAAVSYTHLDVYKRQVHSRAQRDEQHLYGHFHGLFFAFRLHLLPLLFLVGGVFYHKGHPPPVVKGGKARLFEHLPSCLDRLARQSGHGAPSISAQVFSSRLAQGYCLVIFRPYTHIHEVESDLG